MTAAQTKEAADGSREGPVRRLTVLYDERCPDCRQWASWLLRQQFRVPVELLPAGWPAARTRYPHLERWLGRELVVVDDRGRAWVGTPAFVTCLWAMDRYRLAAFIATKPGLSSAAEALFRHLARGRHRRGAAPPPRQFVAFDQTLPPRPDRDGGKP